MEKVSAQKVDAQVLGATWGLVQCKVPQSSRSGSGIKVAVPDTGFDIEHPDFVGRSITTEIFVNQPVQDLHGHVTHTIGTACGPKEPSNDTPRYGILTNVRSSWEKCLITQGAARRRACWTG